MSRTMAHARRNLAGSAVAPDVCAADIRGHMDNALLGCFAGVPPSAARPYPGRFRRTKLCSVKQSVHC